MGKQLDNRDKHSRHSSHSDTAEGKVHAGGDGKVVVHIRQAGTRVLVIRTLEEEAGCYQQAVAGE